MINRLLFFLLFYWGELYTGKGPKFQNRGYKGYVRERQTAQIKRRFFRQFHCSAGSGMQGREAFAYYLNGSIHLNIYGQINLPFSFNLTNSGSSYKLPSMPNRLNIHPSCKWITGHLGDVSMTFSPYTLSGEYGLSLLTSDSSAPRGEEKSVYGSWEGRNMTTSSCQAFKVRLDYAGAGSRLGVGYERIDPGYKTLGAYYFANDLENITLNASQSLWQNKVNISLSISLERDDPARTNATSSSGTVGSASVTVSPTERMNLNLSYTNFQTCSSVRSNFELINRENPPDQPDTLRFVQLSRSANFNLNLVTKKNGRAAPPSGYK
jgi:hypothetical protein